MDRQACITPALYLRCASHSAAAGQDGFHPAHAYGHFSVDRHSGRVSVVWSYNGLSARRHGATYRHGYERSLTTDVDNIEHIESQSLPGVAVIKVFFHPGADINRARLLKPRPARNRFSS